MIYDNEGSLGSRLHIKSKNKYIAYAQWPDKESWLRAGIKSNPSADEARKIMRASFIKIKTLHEMELTLDLSQPEVKS